MKNFFLLFTLLVLTSCFAYSQQSEDENYIENESIIRDIVNEKAVNLKTEETITLNRLFNYPEKFLESSEEKKFMFRLGVGTGVSGSNLGWCASAGIGYQFLKEFIFNFDFRSMGYDDYFKFFIDPTIQVGGLSGKSKFIAYVTGGFGYATGDVVEDCVTGILGGGIGPRLSKEITLILDVRTHFMFSGVEYDNYMLTLDLTISPF